MVRECCPTIQILVLLLFADCCRGARRKICAFHRAATVVSIVAGEIIWGIGVGWLVLRLRRWVRDPTIEILCPF
jgi:hypothetical protein